MSDPVADFLAREQDVLADIEGAPVGLENAMNGPAGDEDLEFENVPAMNGTDSGVDLQAMDQHAHGIPMQRGSENATPSPVPMQYPALPKIEPEKIRKWREEQKKLLEKKDIEEEKKKEELRLTAKKELEQWYTNRADKLAKAKIANRKAEEEFLADRDKGEGGADWDRIAKLCDFNAKNSRNATDLSRLRSILLQLKTRRE